MNATRPEADFEYSRGERVSDDDSRRGTGHRGRSRRRRRGGLSVLVALGGLAGAILLVVAELTPLFTVHSSLVAVPIKTVTTGSHHDYALIPVAVLALVFSVVAWRTGSRAALVGIAAMGAVALVIALAGDLPDAQAKGLVSTSGHLAIATDKPTTGFYLETLGGVLLLLTAAGGLLLSPGPARERQSRARPAQSSAPE